MSRNLWAAILATLAVVAVLILGFRFLGSPGKQRLLQSDYRRVTMLAALAQQINMVWNGPKRTLPNALADLGYPDADKKDPVTGKPFAYRPKTEGKYQLCATFATDSQEPSIGDVSAEKWKHPKGDFCFDLDASQPLPSVPYYY